MILVAIVAELLEEYMVLLARVLEHLLHGAPFPRRIAGDVMPPGRWNGTEQPNNWQTNLLHPNLSPAFG